MNIKDIPQDLVKTVSELIGEIRQFDESPPNDTIKEWIEENRKIFEDKYGLDEGTRILYAKAWNMFKESTAAQHKALMDDCLEPYCEEEEEDDLLLKKRAEVDAQSGLPELGENCDDADKGKVLIADEDEEEKVVEENYHQLTAQQKIDRYLKGLGKLFKSNSMSVRTPTDKEFDKADKYVKSKGGKISAIGVDQRNKLINIEYTVGYKTVEDQIKLTEEEIKESRYDSAIKLVEGFVDTDNLEHEAAIIALSNYPEEYKRKDVDGILRKVKVDLLKQGSQEISDELYDIFKKLKVELQKHFRDSLKENYASPEPASAVGHRNYEEQPKHADLLHDVSIIGGERTDCYRLLVQYSSGRTEFIPPTDQLGAPTPSALLDLVLDIPDDNNVLVYAIEDSLEVPSESEQFSGNDKSE